MYIRIYIYIQPYHHLGGFNQIETISQIGSIPRVEVNIKNVWNHHLVIYVHLGSFVVWEKTVERTSTSQKKKHSLWLAGRARSLRHVRWPHESDQWRLGCCWCCCCRCLNMISMIILHFHTWLRKDESCCISFLRQHILDTKVTLRVWHIGPRPFDLAFFFWKNS